jgi:hypothetical protein
MDRFYTVADYERDQFFQIPRLLLQGKYKTLSNNERIVYSVLKDRFELSLANRWVDEENRIFFYFDQSALSEACCTSLKTIQRCIKNLSEIGLICSIQQGLNRPNRLYLLKPEIEEQLEEKEEQQDSSGTNGQVDEHVTNQTSDNNKNEAKEWENTHEQRKGQNDFSEQVEMTFQDKSKSPTNQTDITRPIKSIISLSNHIVSEKDIGIIQESLRDMIGYEFFDSLEDQAILENILDILTAEIFTRDDDEMINVNSSKNPKNVKIKNLKWMFEKNLNYGTVSAYLRQFREKGMTISNVTQYHIKSLYQQCLGQASQYQSKYGSVEDLKHSESG